MSEPKNKSETRLRELKESGALGCLLTIFLIVLFFVASLSLSILNDLFHDLESDWLKNIGGIIGGLICLATFLVGLNAIVRYRRIGDPQLQSLIERWPSLPKEIQEQIIQQAEEAYAAVGYQGRVATDQQPDSPSD